MPLAYFITHPEVAIDPVVPVPEWPLSAKGLTRMRNLLRKGWVQTIGAICSSEEQKAKDGARILADHLGRPFLVRKELGENDRSSTGYLPKAAFEAMADRFFAHPETSIEGWERAIDAQTRIVGAVDVILETHSGPGDIAIVSHGGVGALLLCHLSKTPISRTMDQPGGGGGNIFCFEKGSRKLVHGWLSFEDS